MYENGLVNLIIIDMRLTNLSKNCQRTNENKKSNESRMLHIFAYAYVSFLAKIEKPLVILCMSSAMSSSSSFV